MSGEDIKSSIRNYIDTARSLKELKEQVKMHTKTKKILLEKLVAYMEEQNADNIDLGDNGGALLLKIKKSKKTLSKAELAEKLTEYFQEHDVELEKCEQFITDLYANREVKLNKDIEYVA